jgi:hypothetical protein
MDLRSGLVLLTRVAERLHLFQALHCASGGRPGSAARAALAEHVIPGLSIISSGACVNYLVVTNH